MRTSASRSSLLLCLALLLASCAGQPGAAEPTAPPTAPPRPTEQALRPTRPPPTPIPPEPTPQPADLPTATAPPAPVQPSELPGVAGETILRLGLGAGPGQTGGPPLAFRIGGDGSIRVLDHANHRLLFFDASGQSQLTVGFDRQAEQVDFIVSREGEIFVSETVPDASKPSGRGWRIIRYSQQGVALQAIPLAIEAPQLSMTADQALVVERDGTAHAIVMQGNGEVVPPEAQFMPEDNGVATPRSPLFFHFYQDNPDYGMLLVSTETVLQTSVGVRPPAGLTNFANVDRAMNLYFRSPVGGDSISFGRLSPDGAFLGGVTITEPGCGLGLRNTYIDQAGTAWAMCGDGEATVIKRYRLADPQGQLLADVPSEPANVAWKPGADIKLTAA